MTDWVVTLEVMLTTDAGVEIPEGMQNRRVQAHFLRKYPDYESLQPTLLRELLELPRANTEEKTKATRFGDFAPAFLSRVMAVIVPCVTRWKLLNGTHGRNSTNPLSPRQTRE
jgi:hypothetical protein